LLEGEIFSGEDRDATLALVWEKPASQSTSLIDARGAVG
jgi:hypothetical protein